MSEYKTTDSGIVVPKKAEDLVRVVPCGSCPRVIDSRREANKGVYIHDGRPMCAVCRVVKLGKMGKRILSETPEALKDQEDVKEYQRDQEQGRINELAAESNTQTLKNLAE